jgi:hypothetical protein
MEGRHNYDIFRRQQKVRPLACLTPDTHLLVLTASVMTTTRRLLEHAH